MVSLLSRVEQLTLPVLHPDKHTISGLPLYPSKSSPSEFSALNTSANSIQGYEIALSTRVPWSRRTAPLGSVVWRSKKPRRSPKRSGGAGTEKRPIQPQKLTYPPNPVNPSFLKM